MGGKDVGCRGTKRAWRLSLSVTWPSAVVGRAGLDTEVERDMADTCGGGCLAVLGRVLILKMFYVPKQVVLEFWW